MNSVLLIVLIYLVLNVISFCSYGWDKHKATENKWRTRESTLLVLGLIGPFGAVAGMKRFHHKTQKPKFRLNYLFLLLHIVAIVLLVKTYVL